MRKARSCHHVARPTLPRPPPGNFKATGCLLHSEMTYSRVWLHNGPGNTRSGEPMQMAIRILANTPVWVFALLAYLLWLGWRSLRPRTQPIWRLLIVPLVFFLMGLSRLVMARDNGLEPLVAWLLSAPLLSAPAPFPTPPPLSPVPKNG